MAKALLFFLLLISLMVLSGCAAQHHYSWTSQTGKTCFYTCGKEYNNCMASLYGGGLMLASRQMSCGRANEYCYAACPDLTQID